MNNKFDFKLLEDIIETSQSDEVFKALIDYCWNDLKYQLKYEEEYGNHFVKLNYPLKSEPLLEYRKWEVNILKAYIK